MALKEKTKRVLHNVFKPDSFKTGLLVGLASYFPLHEAGHAIATEALGGQLQFDFNRRGIEAVDTTSAIYSSNMSYTSVLLAGPAANYLAAFTAALIANKLDDKHKRLKPFLSGFSSLHSLSTGIRYATETLTSFGDFYLINKVSEIPSIYTGIAVGGVTLGLAYYAIRGYVKKKRD